MIKTKENEKGAIIVEIIAVIALLGVMGPLLFKQVLSRNEEVDNINLASEIRAVKDAFSAYILTNKQAELNLVTTEPCRSEGIVIDDYLPYGMEGLADDYSLILCQVSSDDGTAPAFLQGFIVPSPGILPEDMGLKRSARIANLIGSDGGLYLPEREVNGTAGAWHISQDELDNDLTELGVALRGAVNGLNAVYLATTGMDTYVPEYIVEDYSSGFVTIPDDLAFGKLHASSYFSVGSEAGDCYVKKHNTMNISGNGYTAENDIIYLSGAVNDKASDKKGKCDPLFWVGSLNSPDDKSKAGQVYVRNSLHVGYQSRGGSDVGPAVSMYPSGVESGSDTEAYKNQNRIEVYDPNGIAKVIINGNGEIVARSPDDIAGKPMMNSSDAYETLTLTGGQIKSNLKARNATAAYQEEMKETTGTKGTEDLAFVVDPAYTSVMNDIRLESRGGARLSEILPNYITKTVKTITPEETSAAQIDMPSCPYGYAPAIVVMPTSWNKTTLKAADMTNFIDTNNGATTLDIQIENADGTTGSHTHTATGQITKVAYTNTDISNSGLVVRIQSDENAMKTESPNATGIWEVQFEYEGCSNLCPRGDVQAIVHTYCVFDINKHPNKDTGDELDRY